MLLYIYVFEYVKRIIWIFGVVLIVHGFFDLAGVYIIKQIRELWIPISTKGSAQLNAIVWDSGSLKIPDGTGCFYLLSYLILDLYIHESNMMIHIN